MAGKLTERMASLPVVKGTVKALDRIVMPGFEGLTLYSVLSFFVRGMQQGSITSRASSIAFNFFLATFPAILFFFTLIPYIPVAHFQDQMMGLLHDVIPEHAYFTIESTIRDILVRPRSGLLSAGFLMALYFSTNGINSIIEAFNMTIHMKETRTAFRQRMMSVFLVLILSVLMILAIVLITTGTLVLDFLVEKDLLLSGGYYYLIQAVKWIVIISLIYFVFSFLYYFGPVKKTRYKFFSAGSSLATLLTLATSMGFDVYVSNFSRYNALYGSIGTLIILLLWFYFNSIILLVGFELNASIVSASKAK